MSDLELNIHQLDALYKPFPTFAEWSAKTSVDTTRWDRYNAALEPARKQSQSVLQKALQVAKRAAAIDTGAIEGLYEVDRGFTYTVAFEMAFWESSLAAKGQAVRPLFEAQLHAYDYVLDLATKQESISEAAIRTLHQVVCEAQESYRVETAIGPQEQPLPKGQYKVLSNHVRTRKGENHSYAPVDVTPEEMHRFVRELRTDAFLAAHPIIQAAYAHYCFVVIHPFSDGNGRVARALASIFTYRAISMPIIILLEHKLSYLDALEAADGGKYQRFVDFLTERAVDTMQIVEESIRYASLPSADELIGGFDTYYRTKGGYTQDQIDDAGYALMALVATKLSEKLNHFSGAPLTAAVSHGKDSYQTPEFLETHRAPMHGGYQITLQLSTSPPIKATVVRRYILMVPKDAEHHDDIYVSGITDEDNFTARVDELIPSASGILQMRIELFAERVRSLLLLQLKKVADGRYAKNC